MELCLVYMPFGSIEPPPLGIALLSSAARQAGLGTTVEYPCFDFAERIGYLKYNAISTGLGGFQIAEWIFAEAAFQKKNSNDTEYLRRYLQWEKAQNADKFNLFFSEEDKFIDMCLHAKAKVPAFITTLGGRILEQEPKIVGCSSMYHQNCASLALHAYLKKHAPHTITLMGGANCEGLMGNVMRNSFPQVDCVFSGEADHDLVPLCKDLLAGRMPEVQVKPSMVAAPETLPIPDYTEYISSRENFIFKPFLAPLSLSIETSRGCWWGQKHQCTFCGVNGDRMSFRPKSQKRISKELNQLSKEFNVNTFMATDNILAMDFFGTVLKDWEEENYDFFFEVKSNLTRDHVKQLSKAGVKRFQPGMESLHDELLKLLNKGNTAAGNVALLKYALEEGIKVTWLMLVDIPGENDSWYSETAGWIPLISHLQPPHRIKPIRYDRFSEYQRNPEKHGITLEPLEWYRDIYPLNEEELKNFAYHFARSDSTMDERTGPGRKKLEKALTQWMNLYSEKSNPIFQAETTQNKTMITDTRPCRTRNSFTLTGIEHQIIKHCDTPITETKLKKEFKGRESELSKALKELTDNKLILKIGTRYLFPAAQAPLKPYKYPPDYSFPRLQKFMEENKLSYWDILEKREKGIGARAFRDIWS